MNTFAKILLMTLIVAGSATSAAEVSLTNLGQWRMLALSQKTPATGNAHMILTLPPKRDDQYIPTVMVEAVDAETTPSNTEEWRQRLSITDKNAKDSLEKGRYIVEFSRDVGGDKPLHVLLMAEVVGGRVYLFSFNNMPNTFAANSGKVRRLYNRIRLVDTHNRRI